jgi:hypothetical protein
MIRSHENIRRKDKEEKKIAMAGLRKRGKLEE